MTLLTKTAHIHKSVRAQLAIALILIGVVIVTASVVFFSISNTNSMHNEQERAIRNLSHVARLAYSAPQWTLNMSELHALNRAILANKTVVAVNLYDGNVFLVGLTRDPITQEISDDLATPYQIENNDPMLVCISSIIEHEGKEVGRFDIYYSRVFVRKEITKKNIMMAALLLAISFIVLSLIYSIFLRLLITPVVKLSGVTRSIAQSKDYAVSVMTSRNDEIGTLYDNFNDMISVICHNEAELRRTKGFLSNIIESMPSMLVSVDEDGIITQWNKAAEEITGVPAEESIGKHIWMYEFFRNYRELYQDIIRSNESVHLYRQRFEDTSQVINYKNVSLFPLISNGVKGVVIRVDDITEMERKDEQLRQAQKMEIIGNLAGGLAHDFNNVLGGIVGTISLMQYRYAAGKPISENELLNYLATMEKSSKRAADMVQQLLTISRRKEMLFSPVDMNEVITHVVGVCETTFDKSVEFKIYRSEEKAIISADMTQIEQVLLNLCMNAYHSMTIMRKDLEHQGGYITILCEFLQADKHFVTTHTGMNEGDYWKLSVRDTGVGMSEATRNKIFDPFFTTKDKGKGTGLGLSMVYNIVKLHNGCIDVYSEEGLGSTFNVYFPASGGNVSTSNAVHEKIASGEGIIFVVDDESVMRDIAQGMLEECGYSVILAENGLEAVKIFNTRHKEISLVLLDMVMPKMSGKEAYIEMKKTDPSVKVLLASGFRQDERSEEILKMGVKGFIQKPYTIASLSTAISRVLHSNH